MRYYEHRTVALAPRTKAAVCVWSPSPFGGQIIEDFADPNPFSYILVQVVQFVSDVVVVICVETAGLQVSITGDRNWFPEPCTGQCPCAPQCPLVCRVRPK